MLLLSTGVIAAISIGACCASCCLYICCCALASEMIFTKFMVYVPSLWLGISGDINDALINNPEMLGVNFILIHYCIVGFIVGIVTMCIGLILIYNSSISLTVLYCLLFLIIPIGCFCLILCVHGSTFNHDTYRKHGSYRLQ
eukprot:308288_1